MNLDTFFYGLRKINKSWYPAKCCILDIMLDIFTRFKNLFFLFSWQIFYFHKYYPNFTPDLSKKTCLFADELDITHSHSSPGKSLSLFKRSWKSNAGKIKAERRGNGRLCGRSWQKHFISCQILFRSPNSLPYVSCVPAMDLQSLISQPAAQLLRSSK